MKVEIAFTSDQLSDIAAEVVAEMERQGKVMVEPERKSPYSLSEASAVMGVSERTIKRWIEAGRLSTVPGCGRILIVAESMVAIQKGVA